MHSAQPLDILFEEAGASLGRIERELRLKDEARAARFEARLAAIELAAFKAEEERQLKFEARLAELRDGRDGEPGKDGRDADISHLEEAVRNLVEDTATFEAELSERVEAKLAEVKDGKDGEPGRDGKDGCDGVDVDIVPIEKRIDFRLELVSAQFKDFLEEAGEKVDARLAEVKDGKDGVDGKDADTGPLKHEMADFFDKMREDVSIDIEAYKDSVEAEVLRRLGEVQNGEDGKPGDPGPPGKDGKLPIAREWTNRVHYAGDVVRHHGATYQALADTGSEPPSGDWGELASRGTDGRGFVLRGTYDASAEYRQHDIVMINRNSFAAKYDSPGECPGDGWQLFGPSGQRGKEGPPGGKGMDGRSVSILKCEADADEMVLRIVDSLGTAFAVDLQPIAERIVEAAR